MATYVTPPSFWPTYASACLFVMVLGFINWLHGGGYGLYCSGVGLFGLGIVIFLMLREVIAEGRLLPEADLAEVDWACRLAMAWFIFTEVMFFSAFFGTLFYVRVVILPWLAGNYDEGVMTHYLLWPSFEFHWPLIQTPDPSRFMGPRGVMGAWGLPAVNTLILLSSGATITVAHWALVKGYKGMAMLWQSLTILLGLLFISCQAFEYYEAYHHLGLTLGAGIYGNIFFLMTGFHGMHVVLGTFMLTVILFRIWCDHFTKHEHFAFEAVAWYWHFVDVVWLCLFVFVYWL